ncbi:hypothetical protein PF005_g5226 [Phytophthora fragariae]|uniref:Uncharacterized protein n=1 Tax=Phytophthora fragariae TaxID=53985 RepID=A0A6A4A383_9STRA|nr:hypothetical protein PF003_g2700 [Phytophthora fragariae]KAE8944763.1 hypothetical protein PF009_g5558 [Phytophthora fragariae]KAE9023034.1 hypothetical protein PF011_g4175 [Phytophthora fragariae]KAE9128511.1 hypothetical protein PF007_g5235 [Phytophthora fragariae]KAE9128641.1 hypothetical protein PF010_g4429 [Phytophthora fragariae]
MDTISAVALLLHVAEQHDRMDGIGAVAPILAEPDTITQVACKSCLYWVNWYSQSKSQTP